MGEDFGVVIPHNNLISEQKKTSLLLTLLIHR